MSQNIDELGYRNENFDDYESLDGFEESDFTSRPTSATSSIFNQVLY